MKDPRAVAKREISRVIASGDVLPDWMRAVVGRSVQIRIPIRDPIELRRQATILRELANKMEVLSHDKRPAESVLFELWGVARATQSRLQSHPRSEQHAASRKNDTEQ